MGVNGEKPEWVRRLEAKHGLPISQIPGTVYACCYDPPVVVHSVSADYAADPPEHDERGYLSAGPIGHYVGWTQQADPWRRIGSHHPPGTPVTVTMGHGLTMEREEEVKRIATCPTCGRRYSESLTR